MKNKRKIVFFLLFLLTNNCSFDDKTGIWSGGEKERQKLLDLEREQRDTLKIDKIYSTETVYNKKILLNKSLILSKPKNNFEWPTADANNQNNIGNFYLSGIDNTALKKKIGKFKNTLYPTLSPILVFNKSIFFSDDKGTIYNITKKGKIIWKKNIYKKSYKKIYKNLVFAISKGSIYIADNIGFIYSINLLNGELIWIKNYGTPIKSNLKVFENKIFVTDQDNKILCIDTKDGSIIWNIYSITSFIKSQNLLSLSLAKNGDLFAITSSADIFKIETKTGGIYWSRNTAESLFKNATDFFISSGIVTTKNEIIFSADSNTFSYNVIHGSTNWTTSISSVSTPIIDKENIFLVTRNGYLVVLKKDNGEIISSTNILSILKEKRQNTNIKSFIMGSGKIYSLTKNGYLIVTSASTGKNEKFKKIGSTNISQLIINDGTLYMITADSKILGLN